MQTATRGTRAIRSTSEERLVVKAVVAGVTFTEDAIDYISAAQQLFAGDKPTIGSCVAAQLDLDVWTGGQAIPRAAMIRPYVRVTGGDEADGDWLPKGVFWIDTREPDDDGDHVSFHAYDTMLKAEERFLADGDTGTWPRTMATVVSQICTRMGVTLDSRTTLNSAYTIDYPNDYTMRELLGFIGTANGGNWVVTDEGKLRLIRLGDLPAETYYLVTEDGDPIQMGDSLLLVETPPASQSDHSTGTTEKIFVGQDANDFHAAPAFDPISRVTLWVDDDTFVTAGDDTGYHIEADCPWATQTMVNALLTQLEGYVYRPYEATDASIPPAAELGDGVTSNGVYSVIASIETDFNALYTADIAAPAEQEVDHEYPYQSKTQRELARKVALGKSYYGTRIDRLHGLQIVNVNQDGSEGRRVQLNSDVQAFYDASGAPMLYFDPVQGKYIFKGIIQVQKGDLTYGDGDELVLVRYSTDKTATVPSGWSTTWNSAWENSGTEVWAIYSYNGGETWRTPVLVQGKTGAQGPAGQDGDDANIPAWVSAYTSSASYNTLVTGEWVIAMNLYGSRIFAGSQDNEYAEMTANGWKLYDSSDLLKIHLGLESGNDYETPFVRLGAGNSASGLSRAGLVEKFGHGLWIGSSDAMGSEDEPNSGTGFWIDFSNNHVYKVINGTKTDITNISGSGGVTAVWG